VSEPSRLTAKKCFGTAALFVVVALTAAPVRIAANTGCQRASGKGVWTSPRSINGVFPILGSNSGATKAAVQGDLTSINPNCGFVVVCFTTVDTWVLDAQDTLQFTGTGSWTGVFDASGGLADGAVDERTLTITGGTGNYEGATGTITVKGTAYGIFVLRGQLPYFDVRFEGSICTPN
jgi:hypothetical protein